MGLTTINVIARHLLVPAIMALTCVIATHAIAGGSPPTWLEIAQRDPPVAVTPAQFEWRTIAAGFETGEVAATAEGTEVDRIALARIDPQQYRFQVHHSATGNKRLANWMTELGAVFLINGSYFNSDGSPSTPIIAGGMLKGPQNYEAKHGAFVASENSIDVIDLAGRDWRSALAGQQHAMISFPLLVGSTGASRITADPRKIANRSFVAKDNHGRIVLGTTRNGFFGLANFAAFLKVAPLDLSIALNLDGGPLACQGLALTGHAHQFCGTTEVVIRDGEPQVLKQDNGTQMTVLPIVLAVVPKN